MATLRTTVEKQKKKINQIVYKVTTQQAHINKKEQIKQVNQTEQQRKDKPFKAH